MILRASSKFSEKPSLIAPNLKRVSGDTGASAAFATPAASDADPERTARLFQNARRFMSRKSHTNRVLDDLLRRGIPIQSFSGPIGLGGHDAHDRMREA